MVGSVTFIHVQVLRQVALQHLLYLLYLLHLLRTHANPEAAPAAMTAIAAGPVSPAGDFAWMRGCSSSSGICCGRCGGWNEAGNGICRTEEAACGKTICRCRDWA